MHIRQKLESTYEAAKAQFDDLKDELYPAAGPAGAAPGGTERQRSPAAPQAGRRA